MRSAQVVTMTTMQPRTRYCAIWLVLVRVEIPVLGLGFDCNDKRDMIWSIVLRTEFRAREITARLKTASAGTPNTTSGETNWYLSRWCSLKITQLRHRSRFT